MPLYRVKMKDPDSDESREIELMAEDEDEAKFLCEQQARELAVAEGTKPYKISGKPKEQG